MTGDTMKRAAFISHASQDAEMAQKVCDFLEQQGISCWIAPRDVRPGHEFAAEIMVGLNSCKVLVLILSEHANESIYVKREVERTVSSGKPVFPVRIREVMPSQTLEFFVASSQWIDAWKPPIEQYLEQLARAIESATGLVQGGPPPKPSAPTKTTQSDSQAATGKGAGISLMLVAIGVVIAAVGGWFGYQALGSKDTIDTSMPAKAVDKATGSKVPKPKDTVAASSAPTKPQPAAQQATVKTVTAVSASMNVKEILAELGDAKGAKRTRLIQRLIKEGRIPEQLSVDEMLAITNGAANQLGLIGALMSRLPEKLNYNEVMQIVGDQKGNYRYKLINLLAKKDRLPQTMTSGQMLSIIGPSSNYSWAVKLMIERLPKPLGYDDIIRIIGERKGNDRYNLIKLLAGKDRLPQSMTTGQMLSIIGPSSNYSWAVKLMIERLPKPLDYDGIIKIVGPLKGAGRYYIIRLLAKHDRVPAGLSEQQIQSIVKSISNSKRAIKLLTK